MTSRRDEPDRSASLGALADLARDTLQRQLELGRQYAGLARSTWGKVDPRDFPARTYLDSVRREGELYWREVARLGLEYAADVTALGLRAGSAVARDLRAATREAERAERAEHRPEPHVSDDHHPGDHHTDAHHHDDRPGGGTVTASRAGAPASGVSLHGRAGTTATAVITVANRHSRARQIRFSTGPVVDDTGREVDADVSVTPTRLTVPAGEEAEVRLTLEVTADAFEVGVPYECLVEISGGEEATVPVHISRDPD